jgi:CheY-like chemotaxis protein
MDDGIALLGDLRQRWPDVRVVAMSCADGCELPALDNGAVAFVEKAGQPSEFLQAVLAAARLTARPATI